MNDDTFECSLSLITAFGALLSALVLVAAQII